jgi:hypothetical protein
MDGLHTIGPYVIVSEALPGGRHLDLVLKWL